MSQRPSEPSPFDLHTSMIEWIKSHGCDYVALDERVVIEDKTLIPMQYMTRQPDKTAIRRALREGRAVPGARLGGTAYMIIPKESEKGE